MTLPNEVPRAEIARLESVCDDLQEVWLTATAERDDARDQIVAVTADAVRAERELADARAIIAGRTTAPTAAEAALHRRRGGTWLVLLPVESGWRQVEFPDVVAKVWGQREGVRWTAVDAERRFTAWPTVTP